MQLTATVKTIDMGDGNIITIETGKMARQAHGSIILRCKKAVLLCTVVSNYEAKEGQSFFPLTVEYQEKFASAGRIPGGFLRREGRISNAEVLVSRLIDRAIRPLFPDGYMNETQVLVSQISYDEEVLSDALAGLAVSAALTISDIPFDGPISEVRVAKVDGNLVINPSPAQLEKATLEIIVGATEKDVTMVEGEADECSEDELIEAIKAGHEAIKIQIAGQLALAAECGKEKREVEPVPTDEAMQKEIETYFSNKVLEVAKSFSGKKERKEALTAIKDAYWEQFSEEQLEEMNVDLAKEYIYKTEKEVIRNMVLQEQIRLDGRKKDEIRPLWMEIDTLPTPHGSALFTRGETQSLTTVTFGTKTDSQLIDKPQGLSYDNFYLHYNFPPFCTGEAKPMRGTSRREIGHGNLAFRSINQMMPEGNDNPYTIRVVSDILESNGSSSMATVCAGSLALMDAGVPLKKHVSGIAMGMIANDKGDYAILSDILGDEDHLGDMDFKVTGTRDGICACQMDIKVDGLPYNVLAEALEQAKAGRNHILDAMEKTIAEPRAEVKDHAPRIESFDIPKDMIGAVIGPGGKVIQDIQEKSGATVNIEEIKEEGIGRVYIYASDSNALNTANNMIKGIVAVPEVGEVYESVVKSIMPYGAFVEILPGKQGLLHISEISWERIEKMEGVFKEGDTVKVKLLDIDNRGKMKLSRKATLERPARKEKA